jgi:hypothetical protein
VLISTINSIVLSSLFVLLEQVNVGDITDKQTITEKDR